MQLGDRIRAAMERSGLSFRGLASRCGVTSAAVTGWVKNGTITVENLQKVSRATGVPVTWLLGQKAGGVLVLGTTKEPDLGVLGVVDGVQATDPDAYAVVVSGADYDPRYRDGEVLVVYPSVPAAAGDDVLIQLNPGDPAEVCSLVSINPDTAMVTVMPVLGGPRRRARQDSLARLHTIAGCYRAASMVPINRARQMGLLALDEAHSTTVEIVSP